jgi:hypothetical protein
LLRRRGIRTCILPKRRPTVWRPKQGRPVVARNDEYRSLYPVERSFAWLGNFRRLVMRREHLLSVYHGFFAVGVLLLRVRRL